MKEIRLGTIGSGFIVQTILNSVVKTENIRLEAVYSRTQEKGSALAEKYGLKQFLKNYPSSLSGGMRQRAALIRTLSVDPDVLLLDEPFSALDYQTRLSVCDDVYKIIRSEKKTALLITHDISEAISLADKIFVLTRRPAKVIS